MSIIPNLSTLSLKSYLRILLVETIAIWLLDYKYAYFPLLKFFPDEMSVHLHMFCSIMVD